MFDTIAGLPVHILVIHAVVAFAPLAALLAIGYAVRPAWRRVLRWPVALLAVATGVGGFVAAESGSPVEALGRADQALYFAKENGRNQVRYYDDLLAAGLLQSKQGSNDDVELF